MSQPADAEIRAFAERHDLTEAQARTLLTEHGADEDRLSDAVRSLKHFLRAPS